MSREEALSIAAVSSCRDTGRDSLLILLFGMALFTCGLTPEFIGLDARFALFAREMLRDGPSFFPTVYHLPYPDYPAASTFLIYLASLPFGQVTPFTAVLPTAIVSALVLLVTYRIGAMHSRRWGLLAVLFALFTVEFLGQSRCIALDQYTSLATVVSFYIVYSSDRLGRRKRLWLLPAAWVFGFAFRGPIGLVIPAAVSGAYYLWDLRLKRMLVVGIVAGAAMILCLAGLLLAARAQGGTPFMTRVLNAQMIGRMHGKGEGFPYYWYRSLASYALSCPLAIAVIASRFRDITRKRSETDRLLGALTLWVLIVLVGMSIPAVKKTRYIMPIVPALSLIASHMMIDASVHSFLLRVKRTFLGACLWLPLVSAAGVGGLLLFAWLRRPEWCGFSLVTLALLIPPAVAAGKLGRSWRCVPHRDMWLLSVGVVTFIIVNIGVADSISWSLEQTRPFAKQVEALYRRTPGTISFLQIGPDSEDIKFMANLSMLVEPRFVNSLDALDDTSGPHYLITEEETFRSLPAEQRSQMQELARGRIGHTDCVVFTGGLER